MGKENLVHFRNGRMYEAAPEVTSTWKDEDIKKAVDHFLPLFGKTKPVGVYTRVGEDSEKEHEDLFLAHAENLEVLHMLIVMDGKKPDFDEEKEARRYYVREYEWLQKDEHHYIDLHPIPLPFDAISGTINSLEGLLNYLHIDENAHAKVFPQTSQQTGSH